MQAAQFPLSETLWGGTESGDTAPQVRHTPVPLHQGAEQPGCLAPITVCNAGAFLPGVTSQELHQLNSTKPRHDLPLAGTSHLSHLWSCWLVILHAEHCLHSLSISGCLQVWSELAESLQQGFCVPQTPSAVWAQVRV